MSYKVLGRPRAYPYDVRVAYRYDPGPTSGMGVK